MIKDYINEDLEVVKSGHIPGALGIKTVVQITEVFIALTIVIFLGNSILRILSFGVFDEYNGIFSYFVNLFGYDVTAGFITVICALLIVMAGRWAMSWASNNGGQTPNNNGN